MLGGVPLGSQKEAEVFVHKNGLEKYPYLFHSVTTFMEVLKQSTTGGGCADNLVQAAKEQKLGLNPVETAVQDSYLNNLPSVMGDGKKANKLSGCVLSRIGTPMTTVSHRCLGSCAST